MIKEANSKNKDKSLRIRYKEEELNLIKKFVEESKFADVSKYFRWLDESFRCGDLVEKESVGLRSDVMKEINALKNLQTEREQDSEKIKDKIDKLYKLIYEQNNKKVSRELKGQILTLLEKASYTREEISNVLNIREEIVADGLAELLEKEIISYNKKAEYYIIEK